MARPVPPAPAAHTAAVPGPLASCSGSRPARTGRPLSQCPGRGPPRPRPPGHHSAGGGACPDQTGPGRPPPWRLLAGSGQRATSARRASSRAAPRVWGLGRPTCRGGLAIWHSGHRPGGPLTQCGPVRSAMFSFFLSLNSLQLGRPMGYRELAVCCQHRRILLVYVCHCQSIMG